MNVLNHLTSTSISISFTSVIQANISMNKPPENNLNLFGIVIMTVPTFSFDLCIQLNNI